MIFDFVDLLIVFGTCFGHDPSVEEIEAVEFLDCILKRLGVHGILPEIEFSEVLNFA